MKEKEMEKKVRGFINRIIAVTQKNEQFNFDQETSLTLKAFKVSLARVSIVIIPFITVDYNCLQPKKQYAKEFYYLNEKTGYFQGGGSKSAVTPAIVFDLLTFPRVSGPRSK